MPQTQAVEDEPPTAAAPEVVAAEKGQEEEERSALGAVVESAMAGAAAAAAATALEEEEEEEEEGAEAAATVPSHDKEDAATESAKGTEGPYIEKQSHQEAEREGSRITGPPVVAAVEDEKTDLVAESDGADPCPLTEPAGHRSVPVEDGADGSVLAAAAPTTSTVYESFLDGGLSSGDDSATALGENDAEGEDSLSEDLADGAEVSPVHMLA